MHFISFHREEYNTEAIRNFIEGFFTFRFGRNVLSINVTGSSEAVKENLRNFAQKNCIKNATPVK